MEEYRDIKGYEGVYQVSNLGNVKSLSRNVIGKSGVSYFFKERILLNGKSSSKYLVVSLCIDGVKKTKSVHQLVAISFLNHNPNGKDIVVDHIDNNPHNNNVNNLQLISTRENLSKEKRGSSKYTGVYWNKKLSKWQSSIMIDGNSIYLGLFKDELSASKAYLNKLQE